MIRIAVVEPSATLRHAVQRLLDARGYEAIAMPDYQSAARALGAARDELRFSAVVVGIPLHPLEPARALLALLESPRLRGIATLILAHKAEPDIFDWVARRDRSALLLWDDYGDCIDCLSRLLAPAQQPQPAEPEKVGDDIRILFVDDSRTVCASFRRLLREHGYFVEIAGSAAEAIEKARKIRFDIAIVDYFMPGGNGDVLCGQLRDDPQIRGITTAIITGTYLDEVIKDSLEAGAVECMFKNEATELFLTRVAAMSRSIRIQKSIEAERRRLASILSSVGDGVYGVNTAGQVTFINPAARQILGFCESDTVTGRSAHKMFHYADEDGRPIPPESCVLQRAYGAGDTLPCWSTVFWHRSGRPIPVECTVFPLRTEGSHEGSVVAFRDVSQRRLLEKELLWQANHDPLTELYNRNYFERELENEINRLKRSDEKSALLYIDLDRFKHVNDTAGHAAGDQLLIEVAAQLKTRLRDSDVLVRLGGDEFAIILRNVDERTITAVADSFRESLEQYNFICADKHYKINGSIGVALLSKAMQSPGEVMANADIACHIAKGKGRNQTHLFQAGNDEKAAMNIELGWSSRLQEALKRGAFELRYQPIVPLSALDPAKAPAEPGALWPQCLRAATTEPPHYEVLVRFLDPSGEAISPNAFLPTAERFGLMPQIDAWVVTNAVRKLSELVAGGRDVTFSINISGQTLDAGQLVPLLKRLLREHRLDSGLLVFEIAETAAVANIDAAIRLINELRDIGCRFALDDFGTGFGSFYHLKHLPVDFIKIGGHFVQGIANNPIDRTIVTSINDIAHSFGKRTIAEFVEKRAVFDMLNRCGVDYAQGHYIAAPGRDLPFAPTSRITAARGR